MASRHPYRPRPADSACARSLRRAAAAPSRPGDSRPPRRRTSASSAPHSAAGRVRKSRIVVVAISVAPEGRARTMAASRLRSPMAMPNPVPNTNARRQKGSATGYLTIRCRAVSPASSTDDSRSCPVVPAQQLQTQADWFAGCPQNETSPALRRCGADRTSSPSGCCSRAVARSVNIVWPPMRSRSPAGPSDCAISLSSLKSSTGCCARLLTIVSASPGEIPAATRVAGCAVLISTATGAAINGQAIAQA